MTDLLTEFLMSPNLSIIIISLAILLVIFMWLVRTKVISRVLYIEKFPESSMINCKESGDSINFNVHGESATLHILNAPAIVHSNRRIIRLFLAVKGQSETQKWGGDLSKSQLSEFELGVYASKTFFQSIFAQLKEIKQRLLDILIGGIAGAGIVSMLMLFVFR